MSASRLFQPVAEEQKAEEQKKEEQKKEEKILLYRIPTFDYRHRSQGYGYLVIRFPESALKEEFAQIIKYKLQRSKIFNFRDDIFYNDSPMETALYFRYNMQEKSDKVIFATQKQARLVHHLLFGNSKKHTQSSCCLSFDRELNLYNHYLCNTLEMDTYKHNLALFLKDKQEDKKEWLEPSFDCIFLSTVRGNIPANMLVNSAIDAVRREVNCHILWLLYELEEKLNQQGVSIPALSKLKQFPHFSTSYCLGTYGFWLLDQNIGLHGAVQGSPELRAIIKKIRAFNEITDFFSHEIERENVSLDRLLPLVEELTLRIQVKKMQILSQGTNNRWQFWAPAVKDPSAINYIRGLDNMTEYLESVRKLFPHKEEAVQPSPQNSSPHLRPC